MNYQLDTISSQKGRIAIVTGANVGLGFETAKKLAQKDMKVIMACRSKDKAESAIQRIRKGTPSADLEFMQIDLGSQQSVKDFAHQYIKNYQQLDVLINNAGIFMPPYTLTEDGYESQFGVNYLGHFTLTALLLEALEKTPGSRIISLASLAHAWGDIHFEDPHFTKGYDKGKGYGQSKLACLMFAYELQRKLTEHKYQTQSLAAHPGVSMTNLGRHLPAFANAMGKLIQPLIFQNPSRAAEPTVRAALDPDAKGGEYYGPGGFRQYKGAPVKVGSNRNSRDPEKAKRLWDLSEKETGIKYF